MFDYSIRFEAIDKISAKINKINAKMEQMSNKASQASSTIKNKIGKLKFTSEFKLNVQSALKNIKKVKNKLDDVAEKGKASLGKGIGVLTAGAGFLSTIGLPIKTAVDFETKMLSVKSIMSGGYGSKRSEVARFNKDFAGMTAKAQELGATTSWSASQVAEGMKFMSMAGFKASETIDAMGGVLSLATVGEMDLASASDIASNALSGFGLEASKMNKVSDIMAKTITTSNTTIRSLGESFKYVAPISAGLGITVEETSAMLGKLGDAGINGTVAGNALKRMMMNLSAPTIRAKKAMDMLNVSAFDATGKFKPMSEQIGAIQEKIKGYSKSDQMKILKDIFGAEALPSAMVLLKQGQKGIEQYRKSLEKASGTGKKIAEIQLSGAEGKLKLLSSAFEGLMISIGDNFTNALKGAIEKVTSIVEKISTWTSKNKELVGKIGTIVMYVGGFVAIMGVLYIVFGLVSMSVGVLTTVLTVFSTVLKVVQFATLLFNTALWANPITWIVAGVIALITAVGALIYYFEDITTWVGNLWDKFTGFVASLGIVEKTLKGVKGHFIMLTAPIRYVINLIDKLMSKFDIYNKAKAKVQNMAGEVEKKVAGSWESTKSFFGFGNDKKETAQAIDNVQKNHTVVDVNVVATGAIETQQKVKTTSGRVRLNTASNGV